MDWAIMGMSTLIEYAHNPVWWQGVIMGWLAGCVYLSLIRE